MFKTRRLVIGTVYDKQDKVYSRFWRIFSNSLFISNEFVVVMLKELISIEEKTGGTVVIESITKI